MQVVKRDGTKQEFNKSKIFNAIKKAFNASECYTVDDTAINNVVEEIPVWDGITIEEIQDSIIETLRDFDYDCVANCYAAYRSEQSRYREMLAKIEYQDSYINSTENAATSSETDGNANVTSKNVATLESEDRKRENRGIQRYRMKRQLKKMYPELASQYAIDVEHHIIYPHDEASTSVLKQYCMAGSLYPLMLEGVGNIDGVTPGPPNDLRSFSGQVTNLVFLLSSQCKGAVALGGYFIALNYYIVAEFGPKWYEKLDVVVTNEHAYIKRTVGDFIKEAFKQFVWGINQPAGNRSYQSPFTNISYYDHTYFNSLFGEFYYPNGTQPEWEAIDTLQRYFMKWFNKLRLKQVLTFPVETFAMVHNGTDVIDKEYKDLCAEMYSEGHSFFTYISDSADSLASCCRLRNALSKNTFNPTSGLTGIKTGSCNVITLNLNRIVQDWCKYQNFEDIEFEWKDLTNQRKLVTYIITILERVYKYHIAYKTMLYELENQGMLTASKAGYISMRKLFSTIGVNGFNEAAEFLGMEISNNEDYKEFISFLFKTILDFCKEKSTPQFLFNLEVVPAESLGSKNYNWDKEDGYVVPSDRVLYNSYIYNAHNPNISVLDRFILQGGEIAKSCSGGQAVHCNLEDHLSKEQYLKLIDFAIAEGTNYFTFNIPNSQCDDCGFITKHPIKECPKCHSKNITQWTRTIGYLRPIKSFDYYRQIEASNRIYSNGKDEIKC